MLRTLFVLFLAVWSASPLSLPDYLKSCSRNDPKLNECALKSARESLNLFALGDPSRGLLPLDPLYVAEMKIYVPDKNGLKVVFKNNYFKGLAKLHLEDLKFDLDKKLITVDALVTLDVKNEYEVSGKILVLPIRSSGDASIKLRDQINKLLNEMWREIVADVGPSICESLSASVVNNLAVLLNQVPYDELMPE